MRRIAFVKDSGVCVDQSQVDTRVRKMADKLRKLALYGMIRRPTMVPLGFSGKIKKHWLAGRADGGEYLTMRVGHAKDRRSCSRWAVERLSQSLRSPEGYGDGSLIGDSVRKEQEA